MAERSFAPATGQPYKPQNLYMRIIIGKLNRLKTITKQDANFSFAIYKGGEQFDKTNEIPISSTTTGAIPLSDISVDFVVINYNPQSRYVFSLRMSYSKEKIIKEIGQFVLQANKYIDEFILTESGAFQQNISLCDEFQASIQLFIDNSQYGLNRLIRDSKDPKPKKDSQVQNPKASHQRITELRRKMDKEEPIQQNSHKEQKFKRFSPRKDGSEEKNKKNEYINNKRKQQQQKKAQQEQQKLKLQKEQQEEEKKKKKNKQFVPKKQWIIPEAQKFLNQTKAKQLKRKTSKDSQNETKSVNKPKSQESKQTKKSRQKSKVQEQSFLQKLPINPKLLFALLAIILISGSYFLLRGDSSQQNTAPIFPNSKPEKASKAKGKSKKGKK